MHGHCFKCLSLLVHIFFALMTQPFCSQNEIKSDINHQLAVRTLQVDKETYLDNKKSERNPTDNIQFYRIQRRRWLPPLSPIIFERQNLPQQIIYRWKENLMESRIHFKYPENILSSRFFDRFSRFWSILG